MSGPYLTTVADPIDAIPKPNSRQWALWAILLALESGCILANALFRVAQLVLFHLSPFGWFILGVWVGWKTGPSRRYERTKSLPM
ncbi:hypothetical protein D8S78_22005 [Natrialba swarupiae]|nr:hypothetical protein [Natrialba swarupiae]